MDLVEYYTPFRELETMRQNINRLFDTSMSSTMRIDVEETEDEYVLTADVPGFTPEEVEISISGDSMEISAEKSIVDENKEDERKFLHRERSTRWIRRRFNFGKQIDTSKATSTMTNGVLTIHLPKAESAKAVKLIPEASKED